MATPTVTSGTSRSEQSFVHLVLLGAALATAGAGIVHLDAAGDHVEHALIAGFFVAVGVAQLALAAGIAQRHVPRHLVAAVVAVNAGVLLTWLASRTVGLAFVPGVDGAEELGWKDVAASGLEFCAIAMLGLATLVPASAAAALVAPRLARRVVAGMGAATLAVTVPAVQVTHAHDHGHDELAGHHDELAGHHDELAGHHAGEQIPHAAVSHDHAGDPTTAVAHPPGHEHDDVAAPGDGSAPQHVHAGASTDPGDAHQHAAGDHGDGSGGHGDDHSHDAAHAHGDADGAFPTMPAAADPLAGPGNISTLRIGPIPLLPSVPGIELPHLSPAVPFVGPGRLNLLPLVGLPAPCQDCYVLGIKPDLVYADGSPANIDTGPMLHHAVFTDMAADDPVCGRDTLLGQLGHRILAAGNERTPLVLPDGFGMPLGQGPWGGVLELMNMSNTLRLVYVEAVVRWVPLSTAGIRPVTPVWLDIDSCGDSEVDIGAGVTDIVWDWVSNLKGRIVAAAGHVHDGGVWLSAHNESTGEHVCTSMAGYGTKPAYMGSVESMSGCAWDRLATIEPGDVLRLTAHYNTAAPQLGVMGIMLVFVHQTDDLISGSTSPYPAEPPPDTGPADAGHHH